MISQECTRLGVGPVAFDATFHVAFVPFKTFEYAGIPPCTASLTVTLTSGTVSRSIVTPSGGYECSAPSVAGPWVCAAGTLTDVVMSITGDVYVYRLGKTSATHLATYCWHDEVGNPLPCTETYSSHPAASLFTPPVAATSSVLP